MLVLLKKGRFRGALVAMGAGWAVFLVSINLVAIPFDKRSTKQLALQLKPMLQEGDRVYSVGTYAQDLPVYLERLVSLVAYKGELAFGIDSEPEISGPRFMSRDIFEDQWQQGEDSYAVIRRPLYQLWYEQSELPHWILGETPHFLLITNKAPTSQP